MTQKEGMHPNWGLNHIFFQILGFDLILMDFLLIFVDFWLKRVDLEPKKRPDLGGKLDFDPHLRIYINQRFLTVQGRPEEKNVEEFGRSRHFYAGKPLRK
jgi:hypothetical protein